MEHTTQHIVAIEYYMEPVEELLLVTLSLEAQHLNHYYTYLWNHYIYGQDHYTFYQRYRVLLHGIDLCASFVA